MALFSSSSVSVLPLEKFPVAGAGHLTAPVLDLRCMIRRGHYHKLISRAPAALKQTSHVVADQHDDDDHDHDQLSIWTDQYIQSITTQYSLLGEANSKEMDKLKEDIKMMLKTGNDDEHTAAVKQLELIDLLERLGISYHFEDEIGRSLGRIANDNHHCNLASKGKDLYATSLEFRLLRQHGYSVTPHVFESFKDERSGKFKASVVEDTKGLLYLYEASYLGVGGGEDDILEEARSFSRKHLMIFMQKEDGDHSDTYLSLLVAHAMELPLHWRMPRMEARWFINSYEKCQDRNPLLLHFAKLDFNSVQAAHQQDLKLVSRWWMMTGLGENLNFIRDRLSEHFLWTIGLMHEPEYGYFRRVTAQAIALITTIDDIYDGYGTLDQLQLFTGVVGRWDINEVDQLPDYMKMCFFALHNSVSEMAAMIFKDQRVNVLPFIKKAWTDLLKSYLTEAKWSKTGYVPRMQEYINNGSISVAAPLVLSYAYCLLSKPLFTHTLDTFHHQYYSTLCLPPSLVTRLSNDLATSMVGDQNYTQEDDDVPKAIECYMHETGCCEEEAREHVRGLIDVAWKKMNKAAILEQLPSDNKIFQRRLPINLARISQFMYLQSDGHSFQDFNSYKVNMLSLLSESIEIH